MKFRELKSKNDAAHCRRGSTGANGFALSSQNLRFKPGWSPKAQSIRTFSAAEQTPRQSQIELSTLWSVVTKFIHSQNTITIIERLSRTSPGAPFLLHRASWVTLTNCPKRPRCVPVDDDPRVGMEVPEADESSRIVGTAPHGAVGP
jgi:hypothetical protein